MKVSMDPYTYLTRFQSDEWKIWNYLDHCDALRLDGAHIPDCDFRYPHEIYTTRRAREDWKFKPYPVEWVQRVREFCDRRGWEKVLSGWGGPYATKRTDDCLYLTRTDLETATTLGAKILRVVPDGIPDDPRRYRIEWAVRNLTKAAELAESYGIVLGLETHAVIPYGSDIIEIIERVDSEYLKATIDTGNIYSNVDPHMPPMKVVELLAPRTVATHIRDLDYYPGEERPYYCVPCGEGFVDLPMVAQALKDAGYEGTLALEFLELVHRPQGEVRDEAIRKSIEYLRKL
jgi:sugar phosphate isomerase/epimerase